MLYLPKWRIVCFAAGIVLGGCDEGPHKYSDSTNGLPKRPFGYFNSTEEVTAEGRQMAVNKTGNCPGLFSSFQDFEMEPLSLYPDFPHGVGVVKETVDLDQDGDEERVLMARMGTEYDITEGPYSILVIIGNENPAFSKLTKENISILFKPENIQNRQEKLHYTYLSFDSLLYRLGIKGAKTAYVTWSRHQYQKFFRSRRFPPELTKGKPINLRATLARVGIASGKPYLLLNAKPVEFAEDGNTLLGYDKNGRYVGRRFEFLASYHGDHVLYLLCARPV